MGNAESQAPKSYDQHVVHEGDYLQTYHGGGPNEKINMGTNQAPVSIGAKVIQSTIALKDRHGRLQKPGEFYVEDKNGQKQRMFPFFLQSYGMGHTVCAIPKI